MKRLLPLLVVIFIGCACLGHQGIDTAFIDAATDIRPATVLVKTLPAGVLDLEENWCFGSGVIISKSGHILTCFHVVDRRQKIVVVDLSTEEYDAELVAGNPFTDVAVLKISHPEGENFCYAELGDSDALMPGQWVIASGAPAAFRDSITAGVISCLNPDNFPTWIQMDVAINPGSSGGPICTLDGKVIGLACAIVNPSPFRAYAGISFAIPINTAKDVLRDFEIDYP